MKQTELIKLLEAGITHRKAQLEEMNQPLHNTEAETKAYFGGQMNALEDVLTALKGNPVYLQLIGG